MVKDRLSLIILGTRGIPANHGGFETFAYHLAHYLASRGWRVVVYCQEDGTGNIHQSQFNDIQLVHVPVKGLGPLSTIKFDLRCILHSLRYKGVFLTLGYNTAIFNGIYRLFRRTNLINMDGLEWKRAKWGSLAKCWFWINERLGCWFGNHLIADHPEIARHLASRVSDSKITMIPYGADEIASADENAVSAMGLSPGGYMLVIARLEPENSVLEIVSGFSARSRPFELLVVGPFDPASNSYHARLDSAASSQVHFVGGIYEDSRVRALRYFARAYIHGHQVGGTNPSLVEAMGAGNAILAHDNKFNRWVTRGSSLYFADAAGVSDLVEKIQDNDNMLSSLQQASIEVFSRSFRWDCILEQYEDLLSSFHHRSASDA